jgi:hypothetical protein
VIEARAVLRRASDPITLALRSAREGNLARHRPSALVRPRSGHRDRVQIRARYERIAERAREKLRRGGSDTGAPEIE